MMKKKKKKKAKFKIDMLLRHNTPDKLGFTK